MNILILSAVVALEGANSLINVGFDADNGALASLKGSDGIERVLPAREMFSLSLLDAKGNETRYKSSDFQFVRKGNEFTYTRDDGLKVTIWARAKGDQVAFRVRAEGVPVGMRLNWVDAPQVVVKEVGALYWPFLDGCEVNDFNLKYHTGEPVSYHYRAKPDPALYPGNVQMQFLAHYQNGKGLYFVAEDANHKQKGVEWQRAQEGGSVRLSLQTFCGEIKNGVWESGFEYLLKPYDGNWREACGFYRDWVRTLPAFQRPIVRPEWMKDSPVILIYPVKGLGKDNTCNMGPNRYYPYVNALKDVDHWSKEFDSRVMALLMHWEGTAPWCPPYVWPPYGGEARLAEFRDALHAKGNLLGLYCSGTAWTQVSIADPTYSRTQQFTDERLDRWMIRGPKGELDAAVCCHPLAQRFGYELCLTEDWSRKTLIDEVMKMARFGTDYCQFFDQNLGGGTHLCWSDKHHHAPIPGAWASKAMLTLQEEMLAEIAKTGSKMLIGCEASAATPYVPTLFFNDARQWFPQKYGRPVPGLSYVFHEWMCNYTGNQGAMKHCDAFRWTYSFHQGDIMAVVLGDKGHLIHGWVVEWDQPEPNQQLLTKLVKEFSALRRQYVDFLLTGRQIAPFVKVVAPETEVKLVRRVYKYPAVLSSFWETKDSSRKVGFLSNWTEQAVTVTIDGSPREIPPLSTIVL